MQSSWEAEKRKDLFEALRQRTGADYISDLRYSLHREKAIAILAGERAEDFPLRLWNDAVQYLLFRAGCASAAEAKAAFERAAR